MKLLLYFVLFFTLIVNAAETPKDIDLKVYQKYTPNNNLTLYYAKPKPFDFVTQLPHTGIDMFGTSFSKESLPWWGAIAASTGILIYYDQDLVNWAQRVGRDRGLGNDDHTSDMIMVHGYGFRGPTDRASLMYFIGDGWLHGTIMVSFLTTGLIRNDNRAIQTGSQLAQGLAAVGMIIQVLKRSAGRETPLRAEQPRGKWRFFPNQLTYQKNTSRYDAFPSGHLAATSMTYAVITENYPEYNFVVKPIAWTLMTLLGYQMMNNGVHWASDYPLALGIGITLGKTLAKNNRIEIYTPKNKTKSQSS